MRYDEPDKQRGTDRRANNLDENGVYANRRAAAPAAAAEPKPAEDRHKIDGAEPRSAGGTKAMGGAIEADAAR